MPTYTKETALYDTGAIAGDIDLASGVADKYITAVDQNGIKVHAENNINTNYAHISANGMDVFKGGTSVSYFGETVRIGKSSDKSHLLLDYHSLQQISTDIVTNPQTGNLVESDTIYFHVSDLRDSTGYATMTAYFIGDGEEDEFDVGVIVASIESVLVDGVESKSDTWKSTFSIVFNTPPADGSEISIIFKTNSMYAKAYTLGMRLSDSSIGAMSVAEGLDSVASGFISHAEGKGTNAMGQYSHAEGNITLAKGDYAHSEGRGTKAIGKHTHAEGYGTEAHIDSAHAEGWNTKALAVASHTEGIGSKAEGSSSHAEGANTIARGRNSHASGLWTIAGAASQTVIGQYNIEDVVASPNVNADLGKYILILGNGIDTGGSTVTRSNAMGVTWKGDIELDLKTSGTVDAIDRDLYAAITAIGWQNSVIV